MLIIKNDEVPSIRIHVNRKKKKSWCSYTVTLHVTGDQTMATTVTDLNKLVKVGGNENVLILPIWRQVSWIVG